MNENKEKQMQEMAVSILLDEYTQLDVAQLLKEYEEAEESGDVPNVPQALDAACTRLIRKARPARRKETCCFRFPKALTRVAMVVLVLIGLCTVTVLSVDALRVPALRFVLEVFDRHTTVRIEESTPLGNTMPEKIIDKLANCVPADYAIIQQQFESGKYHLIYSGKEGQQINLLILTDTHVFFFDNETTETQHVQINGHDIVFASKNGYKAIWLNAESGFVVELRTLRMEKDDFWEIVYKLLEGWE